MPPNLGGFFMVRSYYPSECHADYFDFERIEALKPAIEACGISTLSQSPMLGFHKQMDNRIKLFYLFQVLDAVIHLLIDANHWITASSSWKRQNLFQVLDAVIQCLASISRWITASSSWKRFCLFVCRALSSIMVICMLTAIRLLLTFVMSLYLLLRS